MRAVKIVLVIGLFSIGCGREGKEERRPETPPAETAVTTPAESLATITGTAFLDGTPTTMPRLSMGADRKCAAMHDHPVYSEQVVVGGNGSLQNVFIYLKEGLEGRVFKVPDDTVVLNQEGCVYKPHVLGIQANQPLQIVNSDPTLHNIHALPQINRGFNMAQPRRGMKTGRTFTLTEVMIRVKCDVHPWMGMYIGVLEHPYFAVTGSDGSARLEGLPPGEYVIAAWHERYGEKEQRVTVGAVEDKRIEFRFTE